MTINMLGAQVYSLLVKYINVLMRVIKFINSDRYIKSS